MSNKKRPANPTRTRSAKKRTVDLKQARRIGATTEQIGTAERINTAAMRAPTRTEPGDHIDLRTLRADASLYWVPGDQLIFAHVADKRIVYKPVTHETVRLAFSTAPVVSDWLTPNTVRWGVTPEGRFEIQWWPPAMYRFIGHDCPAFENIVAAEHTRDGLAIFDVPLPGFVFAGVGSTYAIFATDAKSFDPKMKLFRAPLPNCYDNGSICWGQSEKPKVGGGGLQKAWRVFWQAPFTSSVVNGKSRTHPDDVRHMLALAADVGSTAYPLKDLVSANATLEQFAQKLASGQGGQR